MSRKILFISLLMACFLCFPTLLLAGGKGQGAIVSRDTDKLGPAPIFESEEGDAQQDYKAMRGMSVAGITTFGLVHEYLFEKRNGRVHVIFYDNEEQKGVRQLGWMNESDLTKFYYECGCGNKSSRSRDHEECSPTARAGFIDTTWNPCYEEARDKKLEELQVKWKKGSSRKN
jgi:hypothetical protein